MMDGLVEIAEFGQAALEHIDSLYGYALALTHNMTEAEDLVQDTYLRAASAAHRPDINGNLKSWMFVIMRNAWLNEVRHKNSCLLYTSDAADERSSVDLGGRR